MESNFYCLDLWIEKFSVEGKLCFATLHLSWFKNILSYISFHIYGKKSLATHPRYKVEIYTYFIKFLALWAEGGSQLTLFARTDWLSSKGCLTPKPIARNKPYYDWRITISEKSFWMVIDSKS